MVLAANMKKKEQREGTVDRPLPQASSRTHLCALGWLRRFDAKSDRFYYVEMATKTATWKPPPCWFLSSPFHHSMLSRSRMLSIDCSRAAASNDLKKQEAKQFGGESRVIKSKSLWLRKVDPRNSRPYYVNRETRQTTWVKPDSMP